VGADGRRLPAPRRHARPGARARSAAAARRARAAAPAAFWSLVRARQATARYQALLEADPECQDCLRALVELAAEAGAARMPWRLSCARASSHHSNRRARRPSVLRRMRRPADAEPRSRARQGREQAGALTALGPALGRAAACAPPASRSAFTRSGWFLGRRECGTCATSFRPASARTATPSTRRLSSRRGPAPPRRPLRCGWLRPLPADADSCRLCEHASVARRGRAQAWLEHGGALDASFIACLRALLLRAVCQQKGTGKYEQMNGPARLHCSACFQIML
jgi:hypothetical protein